jgi:hypothetical protein
MDDARLLERQAYNPLEHVLVLRRSTLLFGLGMLAGYFWLMPVFVPPGSTPLHESGQSIERILRVLSVALLLPFVWQRILLQIRRERILRMVLWVFIGAPALSLLSIPGSDYLVATFGPFAIGGMSLVCLSVLKADDFRAWTLGIGLVAIVFFGLGVARYGFEMPTFYGTPRAHFGFTHPTQSSSAVIVAGLFLVQWVSRIFRRRLWAKSLSVGMLIIVITFLLYLAMSRNTLLALLVILLTTGYAALVRRPAFRYGLFLIVLLMVCLVYNVSFLGNSQDVLWIIINEVSSGRLVAYRDLMAGLDQETAFSALIGPSVYLRNSAGGFTGFAATDSVYLSMYLNYGLVTLASFILLLLTLGRRLSHRRAPLAYGCLCALTIFYALDAQGITASNLAVFLLLAYAVRNAMARPLDSSLPPGISYRPRNRAACSHRLSAVACCSLRSKEA